MENNALITYYLLQTNTNFQEVNLYSFQFLSSYFVQSSVDRWPYQSTCVVRNEEEHSVFRN